MTKNKLQSVTDGRILACVVDLQKLVDKRFPRCPQGALALLAKLAETGRACFGEVKKSLGFTQSRCSRICDSLAKRGFISRAPVEHDARQTMLALTPSGSSFVREVGDVIRRAMSQIYL